MTKYAVILTIMDMASAKFDVNGPKKKVCFWRILIKKIKIKNKNKKFYTFIYLNCIELNLRASINLKMVFATLNPI